MLKHFLWIIAVVLVANAGALAVVARNGSGAPDATLQLTERELRLTNLGTDTTGMTLTLEWDRRAVMPWFDRAKLTALGFDCSMPPEAPEAVDHYSGPGILPRSTYVVFEYDPDTVAGNAQAADTGEPKGVQSSMGAQPQEKIVPEYAPRLRPVDVGNDPRVLRSKHTDRHRYLITAGTVRPDLVRASATQPARLQGQVLWIDPIQVYVPQEMQGTIAATVGKDAAPQRVSAFLTRAPRYEVTVEYGSRLLPRVVAVRALSEKPEGPQVR
jgi:hypothetical protein